MHTQSAYFFSRNVLHAPDLRPVLGTNAPRERESKGRVDEAGRWGVGCCADVPFGVLLSGGLDSSLVASIANRHMAQNDTWGKLHSFCVGLQGDWAYERTGQFPVQRIKSRTPRTDKLRSLKSSFTSKR